MKKGINWILLINAMLGNFLAGLSARIFMISLPTVANGLATDILGISWALISFQLARISLTLVFGRLGDIYGRHTIYGLGFIILTVSSFLCGVSQDIFQLIMFHFLQGVGSAMTQSAGRALAMDAMPEGYEGKAQGLMTVTFHLGFFVGPPLGGLIIDYLNWRGIFFSIIPIGAAGIALSYMRPKESSEKTALERRPSMDYVGASLLVALTVILALLFDRKPAAAVDLRQKGLLLLAFAGALWGFLTHESKARSPMMDLSLFKIRMFTYSVICLLAISINRSLVGFFIPFYLQGVLHLSASFMGILFLAPPIFTVTLATVSGHMTDRIGPKIPATIGVIVSIMAVAIGVYLRVDSHWILPTIMIGLTGIETAFNSPNHAAIIGSVPREHRGFATGMVHTAFDVGHMLGFSLGGLLLTLAFQYYSGMPGAIPSPENPRALVFSMNACYMAAIGIGLIALVSSLLRGGMKIQTAPGRGH